MALAYEREMQAMDSPTTSQAATGTGFGRTAGQTPTGSEGGSAQLAGLLGSLQGSPSTTPGPGVAANSVLPGLTISGQTNAPTEAFEAQNMQDRKEAFLARARAGSTEIHLNSARTKPAGPYEIKAGWDTPAVLEQALYSDLPGKIKALVRENVYDSATGRYLLIPQGDRLVGAYDSRVGYGGMVFRLSGAASSFRMVHQSTLRVSLDAVDLTRAALVSGEERMIRDTTITMPRVLHKKLKKIADERDSSMNILVNTALAHWLAKKGALRLG